MVKGVKWSPKAVEQYQGIVEYFVENVSTNSAEKWLEIFWEKIEFVSTYPETGRKAENNNLVQFVNFAKNYRLYYRVQSDSILKVLAIFDTRQNPSKRPF